MPGNTIIGTLFAYYRANKQQKEFTMSNKNLIFPGFSMFFDDMPTTNWFDHFRTGLERYLDESNPKDGTMKPHYYTNKDGSELYVELPGCKKEDISVEADANAGIVVRATREVAGKKDSYRIAFSPDRGGLDVDEMKPTFVDGLLTIQVKDKKQETKRRIAIE